MFETCVYRLYSTLLAHHKQHIRNFAAESFTFLMRKVGDNGGWKRRKEWKQVKNPIDFYSFKVYIKATAVGVNLD